MSRTGPSAWQRGECTTICAVACAGGLTWIGIVWPGSPQGCWLVPAPHLGPHAHTYTHRHHIISQLRDNTVGVNCGEICRTKVAVTEFSPPLNRQTGLVIVVRHRQCVCVCAVCVCAVCVHVCVRKRDRDRKRERETDRQTERMKANSINKHSIKCFSSNPTIFIKRDN